MKIKLVSKYICNKISFRPGCDKSEALFDLLQRDVKTNELHFISKMGFEIEIFGDKKEFEREIRV